MDDNANSLERQEILPKTRGGKGRRTRTTIEREELGDKDDEEPSLETPLFQQTGEGERSIDRIDVFRQGPIEEGLLGKLSPEETEESIKNQWGGGTYIVYGKNSKGIIISKRTLRVAGDPIWSSHAARAQWKRMNPDIASDSHGNAGPNMMEVLQMMEAREEKARKEAQDREDQRMQREQQAYDRRRQEEREWEERKAREEREFDEKRRRDEDERERRRRLDDEEREKRARVAAEEAEARRRREAEESDARRAERERLSAQQTQDFFKSMLSMNQQNVAKSDPMDQFGKMITAFAAVKETFGAEGAAVDDDPWMVLVKQLPSILKSGVPVIGQAVQEIRGVSTSDPARQIVDSSGQPIHRPAQQAVGADGSITLPPALGKKFTDLAMKWMSEGKDPEEMFSVTADYLLSDGKVVRKPVKVEQPQQTQAAQATQTPPTANTVRRKRYKFQAGR